MDGDFWIGIYRFLCVWQLLEAILDRTDYGNRDQEHYEKRWEPERWRDVEIGRSVWSRLLRRFR